MKTIRPWDKESERILNQIVKNGKAYTNNNQFTRTFGRKFPDLFDKNNGFLDIARIEKRRESVILPRDNVNIVPIPDFDSDAVKLRYPKKFGFFKTF